MGVLQQNHIWYFYILPQDIVDNLEAALEQFREIAADLGGNGPEVDKT